MLDTYWLTAWIWPGFRVPLNGGIPPPPFVTCVCVVCRSGFRSSRFGPTWPFVPASLRVWQAPHCLGKICLPCAESCCVPPPPVLVVPWPGVLVVPWAGVLVVPASGVLVVPWAGVLVVPVDGAPEPPPWPPPPAPATGWLGGEIVGARSSPAYFETNAATASASLPTTMFWGMIAPEKPPLRTA